MAPRQPQFDPQYLDEHHQRISEFADEYFGDDPEEHDAFVDTLLERRGYTRTASWAPPPPEDPNRGRSSAGGGAQPPAGPKRPAYFKR